MIRLGFLPYVLGVCLLFLAGCKKESAGAASGEQKEGVIALNGAGATFPYPLYSKWMAEYNRQHPNVRINYQSIGSGGGIRQIVAQTVDFGATDAPMKEDEAKGAARILHVPTTIGAVVITYNLPEVKTALKLTQEALSGIFMGDIKKWNDPKLTASNPGVALPNKTISVVYRTDGSGTTAVFTDYLAKIAPAFKEKVGAGKSVKWPVGLGAKGNEGVTGQVKTTPGAIGYVEIAYALQNKMPVSSIRNKAGQFIEPKIDSITAAAAGVEMPDTLYASIADPEGESAYPIAAYTYILVYEDSKDATKGDALAKFLWWAAHDGQQFAAGLHYAPLPVKVVAKIEERLKGLRSGDKKFLSGA
jgi:phosphate transport system substrate-binding protein